MKPSEVVVKAIDVLNAYGWCQGAAARDRQGNDIRLYEVSAAGDGRTRINQAAASFSIYGAIAKAMQEAGEAVPQAGLMWDTLHSLAKVIPSTVDHIHPVVAFNENMDRTKDEVIGFLQDAVAHLEMLELGLGEKPAPSIPPIEEQAFGDEKMKAERAIPAPPSLTDPEPPAVTHNVTTDVTSTVTVPVVGQVGFPKTTIVDHLTPAVDSRLPSIDWRT